MAKQLASKMVVALALAAGGGNTVEGVMVNPAGLPAVNVNFNLCDNVTDAICQNDAKMLNMGNGWVKKPDGKVGAQTGMMKVGNQLAAGKVPSKEDQKELVEKCCKNNGSSC